MALQIPQLQRFIYSHFLLGGLRHSIGVLLPAMIIGGVFKRYDIGMIASMGALCVAIIDQPGGPRRYRINEMLSGAALGTLTAFITGLASSSVLFIWLLVPTLSFLYSLLNVFGKRGGLIGFACLLLMTLTLRVPMSPSAVLMHTLYTAGGALFYFSFSVLFRKIYLYREERRTLSMALFSTAEYIKKRAMFYDAYTDLDSAYRELIQVQATMTEAQQTVRQMVLRELPKEDQSYADAHRVALLTLYTNTLSLLELFVATHTDYTNLRKRMADSDFMLFARDALLKMADNVAYIALNVSRHKKTPPRYSVKAELRAIEYEMERYKRSGLHTESPETYALLLQILRRLRNAEKTITHMAKQTRRPSQNIPIEQYLDKSLSRFLSRDEIRFGMLRSHLHWRSPHFRYAIRVSCATFLALLVPSLLSYFSAETSLIHALTANSHWVILTTLVIMRPGFALTKQRNRRRLGGTLIGCVVAFGLFQLTHNTEIYFTTLVIAYILANSLNQLNYLLSAIFNTIFVLIAFQFLHAESHFVIGERLIDTVLGSLLALLSSYIFPWWESSSLNDFAKKAIAANKKYLTVGLEYAQLNRQFTALRRHRANTEGPPNKSKDTPTLEKELHIAHTQWRVARGEVHVAFSNFAASFYRMMNEPLSQQQHISAFNNLLLQNHVLASQISAAIPLLAALPELPPGICTAIDAIQAELNHAENVPKVGTLETTGELAMLAYPLRQMLRASHLIRTNRRHLVLSSGPPAPSDKDLALSATEH